MAASKRALLLVPRLPHPLDDGGKVDSYGLMRALQWNGYATDVVAFASPASCREPIPRHISETTASCRRIGFDAERQYPGTLLRALLGRRSYFASKYYSRAFATAVGSLLKAHQYDCVILDHAQMGCYLPLLLAQPRRPRLVLRQQNVESAIIADHATRLRMPGLRGLLDREARVFRDFERSVLESVDLVLAITKDVATVLDSLGARRVEVCEAFLNLPEERLRAWPPRRTGEVLLAANFRWPPNARGARWFLREVWPIVAASDPSAHLVLAGRDPSGALRRLAEPWAEVTGRVQDLAPYYQRAHLAVAPILDGSGVRMKILDALSNRCEVIATSLGARDISAPGITVVDGAREWAEVILQALAMPPRTNVAGEAHVWTRYHWKRRLELGVRSAAHA